MLQETCTRMFPWTSPRLIGCPLRCLCRRLHKRRHVHVDVFEISFLEEPLPRNSPRVDSRATTTVQTLEVLVAHHDWVFQNPTLGHFAKERFLVLMAVRTQFVVLDYDVVVRDTLPMQVQYTDVSEAALHVFNNFVEKIAKVFPGAATKKEKRETLTMQVRHSQHFMKPVETLLPPTSSKSTL